MHLRLRQKCKLLIWPGTVCYLLINYAEASEPTHVIDPVGTMAKLAFALIFVLALFWLLSRLLNRLQGLKRSQHNGLRIVGALSVGQRERVIVIEAGEKQILLGVTSTQINTLHILENPLVKDVGKENSHEFKHKLSAAMKTHIPEK